MLCPQLAAMLNRFCYCAQKENTPDEPSSISAALASPVFVPQAPKRGTTRVLFPNINLYLAIEPLTVKSRYIHDKINGILFFAH